MRNIKLKMNKITTKLSCNSKEQIWSHISSLDFDASDEELERFYEHAESCPYHKALLETETASLTAVLDGMQTIFNINEDNAPTLDLFNITPADKKLLCTSIEAGLGLSKSTEDELFNESSQNNIYLSYCSDLHKCSITESIEISDKTFEQPRTDLLYSMLNNLSCKKIECEFSLGIDESIATLMYFSLYIIAETAGADIISQAITDLQKSHFRASYKMIANKQQVERISSDFKSHMGVIATYVTEEPLQNYIWELSGINTSNDVSIVNIGNSCLDSLNTFTEKGMNILSIDNEPVDKSLCTLIGIPTNINNSPIKKPIKFHSHRMSSRRFNRIHYGVSKMLGPQTGSLINEPLNGKVVEHFGMIELNEEPNTDADNRSYTAEVDLSTKMRLSHLRNSTKKLEDKVD